MEFLRGKVTYLAALGMLALSIASFVGGDSEAGIARLAEAAALFGLRRALPGPGSPAVASGVTKSVLVPLMVLVAAVGLTACSTPGFGGKTEPITSTQTQGAQTVGRTQGAATSIGVSSNTYNVYVAGMDAQVAKALTESLKGVPPEQLAEVVHGIADAFRAAGVTVQVNPSTSPSTVDNAGLGGEGGSQPVNEPEKPIDP